MSVKAQWSISEGLFDPCRPLDLQRENSSAHKYEEWIMNHPISDSEAAVSEKTPNSILRPDVNKASLVFRARWLNSCVSMSRAMNHTRTEWDQCVSKTRCQAQAVTHPHMWAKSDCRHVFCMVIIWSTFSQGRMACGEPGNSWWRGIRSRPEEWSCAEVHTSGLAHRVRNPHGSGDKLNFTMFHRSTLQRFVRVPLCS